MIDKEALYLDVEISTSLNIFDVGLSASSQTFDISLEGGGEGRFPYYDGSYEVTPLKTEQILPTENKSMKDDLIVKPIYYAETLNQGCGYTAVIGTD